MLTPGITGVAKSEVGIAAAHRCRLKRQICGDCVSPLIMHGACSRSIRIRHYRHGTERVGVSGRYLSRQVGMKIELRSDLGPILVELHDLVLKTTTVTAGGRTGAINGASRPPVVIPQQR